MILSGGVFYNKVEGNKIEGISNEYKVNVVLASGEGAGGIVSLLNPFGEDIIVVDAILEVTIAADAAATVNVGIDADGETGADNLIDGVDVNTAAGLFDNRINNGTNGGMQVWGATQYLVASKASGSVAGIEGVIYIKGIAVQE